MILTSHKFILISHEKSQYNLGKHRETTIWSWNHCGANNVMCSCCFVYALIGTQMTLSLSLSHTHTHARTQHALLYTLHTINISREVFGGALQLREPPSSRPSKTHIHSLSPLPLSLTHTDTHTYTHTDTHIRINKSIWERYTAIRFEQLVTL